MSGGAAADDATLFEQAPAGYVLLDANGCIERINRIGADLLGWDPTWLAGQPLDRWLVPADRPRFAAYLQSLCADDSHDGIPLRIRTRQGRVATVRLDGAVAAGRDGSCGWRCILIDISAEQRSARCLRQRRSRLERGARVALAAELASDLAHELNQPLATVVLNCEMALCVLEQQGGAGELATALSQARDAATVAGDVVRQLRRRFLSDGSSRTTCGVSDLLDEVLPLLQGDAADHEVQLTLDIAPALAAVWMDPMQIAQVLLNLVHNGIEAIGENEGTARCIQLRAYPDGPGSVRISVADSGPGLDAAQRRRLFMPCFTTRRDAMGMGLAVSRAIVEAHGGQLWADETGAEGAAGATFHFTLPAGRGAAHAG